MREYTFMFTDGLKVGLMKGENIACNEPGLIAAYNVRITENGILPYEAISNVFNGLPDCSWPYPQVFNTKNGIVIATGTALYTVDDSYTCTEVITGITENDLWDMADFGLYQVFVNGNIVIYRDTDTGSYIPEYGIGHTIGTVCDFNEQLIAGNLGAGMRNFVAWSDIGAATLTPLLTPDIKNVRGYAPTDSRGTIVKVKKLGKGVVVYGTDAISYLFPSGTTFGKDIIAGYGIPGKGFVAGDDKVHLFIDAYNRMHILDANLKNTILGYTNYIGLLDDNISITFDPMLQAFYISDGNRCFRLEAGLSEVFQSPAGIARVGGILVGVTYDNSDISAYITTNSFDINTRSIKMIQAVETNIPSITARCGVYYKYANNGAFALSRLKTVNKHGIATPQVSGMEFQIHLIDSSYTDFKLDSIIVHYKMQDKRFIRGPHAEPANL